MDYLTIISASFKKRYLLIIALFLLGFSFSFFASNKIPHELSIASYEADNVWFNADLSRVYSNLTDRGSDHYRTKVHPLFSISTYPFIYSFRMIGVSPQKATQIFISLATGLWLITFSMILFWIGLKILDCIIYSLLVLMSASSVFFTPVPETFLFGSLSILLVLILVVISKNSNISYKWYIFISAISLSMTVTNWMAGLIATIANNSWKRSAQITVNAFLLVTAIWIIQYYIFNNVEFFLISKEEKYYILLDASGGIVEKLKVFFIHSMIIPDVPFKTNSWADNWPYLTIQLSDIGGNSIKVASTTIWLGLLLLGGYSAFINKENKNLLLVLVLIIIGQLFLHLLYGDETFLYSLHWIPLLIILSSYTSLTSLRPYTLIAAIILVVTAGINNVSEFNFVTEKLKNYSNTYNKQNYTERRKLIGAVENSLFHSQARGEGGAPLSNTGRSLE